MVGAFGAFVLAPTGLVEHAPVVLARQVGTAAVEIPLPADPALLGIEVHAQAVVRDEGGARGFTNARRDRILR